MDDGSAKSTFSVIGSAKEPVEVPDVKKIVEVFNKLLRRYVLDPVCEGTTELTGMDSRYKYLQKPFEETALRGILQYTNKFTPVEREKLAVATALFVGCGLASANILTSLKKDHLVKDCESFLTGRLRAGTDACSSYSHVSHVPYDLPQILPCDRVRRAPLLVSPQGWRHGPRGLLPSRSPDGCRVDRPLQGERTGWCSRVLHEAEEWQGQGGARRCLVGSRR